MCAGVFVSLSVIAAYRVLDLKLPRVRMDAGPETQALLMADTQRGDAME